MVVKDVARGVAPYVLLGALVIGAIMFRKQIADWIKDLIPSTGDVVTYIGDVKDDIGVKVDSIIPDDFKQEIVYPWNEEKPYHVFTDTEQGRQDNLLAIPGLVIATPDMYPTPIVKAVPAPSPLAIDLGLTGDPVSGYDSVMAPYIDPPSTGGGPGRYDVGTYYNQDRSMMLEITPYGWQVFRADPRYAGVGNEGWAGIQAGGGSSPAAWLGLSSWENYFGVV